MIGEIDRTNGGTPGPHMGDPLRMERQRVSANSELEDLHLESETLFEVVLGTSAEFLARPSPSLASSVSQTYLIWPNPGQDFPRQQYTLLILGVTPVLWDLTQEFPVAFFEGATLSLVIPFSVF